uniref:inositol monophosphatase family protein n=1 Tax=Neorhizobium sp. EC2-8 TaxID=3129230 RepID=UPI0031013772
MFDKSKIIEVAERAARQAGRAVIDQWSAYRNDIHHKGMTDVVSAADFAADRIVSAAINNGFPRHRILSEEGASADELDFEGPLWIIDPIDGTANYVRGHGYFAISIAFAVDGVVQVGCVHAPMLGETFLATKGGGSKLNGRSIKASSPNSLIKSIVSTGFPHEKPEFDYLIKRVSFLLRNCQDVRRVAPLCWTSHMSEWVGWMLIQKRFFRGMLPHPA